MGMRTIDVTFESLERLPISQLLGMHGVYVLWEPSADDAPTYLGEGSVLARLNKHIEWLRPGVTGIAATVEDKREAEIAEATLLWVAEEINRWPTRNSAAGKWKRIDQLLDRHTSLRLNVRGKHPFVRPWLQRSNLSARAQISVWPDGDHYQIEIPWNRRS
jgi:hypothetical protein